MDELSLLNDSRSKKNIEIYSLIKINLGMPFSQLRTLRIFIILFIAVFLTNTVYASGMMIADQFQADHHASIETHVHNAHDMSEHDHSAQHHDSMQAHHHKSGDPETAEMHAHDSHDMSEHNHKGHHDDQNNSEDHCSKCGHCLACFTVLPPNSIPDLALELNAIKQPAFSTRYHSVTSALPHKPPIS